jgi:large subunit ribosomal protein L18
VKHEKQMGRQRLRRRRRVRNRLHVNLTRPRLSVFRSHKHIYAQIIDDAAGRTLAAAGTQDKQLRDQVRYGGNKTAASVVGQAIAQRALEAGIKQVAFDRREYRYHGRVAALADAARDAGLDIGAKKVLPEKPPEPQAPEPKKKKKSEGKEGKPEGKKPKKPEP